MNRKILSVIGIVMVLVSVVVCIAFCLLHKLSVSYKCQVDFLYEFDRPFKEIPGRGILNANESNRTARYESIIDDFRREIAFCSSKDGLVKCRHDPALQGESESCIRSVLASVRLDVVGMPSTNFVYSCRLVLSNGDKRNLEAYARFCMDMVKEQLNEENELSVAKCTTKEFQSMKKAERKIDEIESAAKSGNAIASSEEELRLAWRTVSEMKQKIEEIRSLVMSTGGRRIVYESQPEFSWVIRRKTCK